MTAKLALRWKAYHLPKRGHKSEEYEDAFAGDPQTGRFAVADGASESSFAGLWAKLLVEGFVHPAKGDGAESHWLEALRQRWAAAVDKRQLPWFAEEKRQQGAFATFLGLNLKVEDDGKGGRWRVSAVGDSCFFHVRQDKLLVAFPIPSSKQFGNQPALIGSRQLNGTPPPRSRLEWGNWRPGDRFFLMTDALAHWFLRRHEAQLKPWNSLHKRLAEPKGEEVVTAYLDERREKDGLRNDDMTLIIVDL